MGLITLLLTLQAIARPPFASPAEARELVREGARVLDTRSRAQFREGHLAGAASIDWADLRDGVGRTGRLDDDDVHLARALGGLGVDDDHAVVVCGAATHGFGEEGRVAWMLSYLGHPRVYVLDGGVAAWRDAGLPLERGTGTTPPASRFTPRRQPALRAELADARRASAGGSELLLDVRTVEEWRGATPYHESRGGHLPRATLLPWTALFDDGGRLRPASALEPILRAHGLVRDRPIIIYCTAGVRSAFVWAALRALGYTRVRNFNRSFYAWADERELPVLTDAKETP